MKETVVITGAGSGLGESLAKQFSAVGHHVCLLGKTKAKLEQTAAFLKNDYSIYELDVTSSVSVENVMKEIWNERERIDCLVNNAGVGMFKYAEEINESEINQMIDTNLKGTIYCTQRVLEGMKKKNKGLIVNIVSASGKYAKATESVYSASKFGVRGFIEALGMELAETNIQVFSAYMGNMETNLWRNNLSADKQGNYMESDEVAEIIVECLKPRKNLAVSDITIMNQIKQY